MKKVLIVLVCCCFLGIAKAQLSDTLLRSAGFYLSPAMTDIDFSHTKMAVDPQFSGSVGFRFINKLKKGFFLEGGIGLGVFGGKYPEEERTWFDYSYYGQYGINIPYTYTQQRNVKEVNWMVPFLVGYKTQKGKVRFEGALGISFNLRNFIIEKVHVTSGIGPSNNGYSNYNSGDQVSFGTSFMGVARAGISIPIKKRINIEILPTARYRLFNFTVDRIDLAKSIQNTERPWSVGLDIGIMFSLDDLDSEDVYDNPKPSNVSYTFEYKDSIPAKPIKKKLLNDGPKNAAYIEFGGNGFIYSLNYERTVFRKGIVNIQARLGMGFAASKYTIPIGVNLALGTGRKKFEMGVSCTIHNFNRDSHFHMHRNDADYNTFNFSIDPSLAFRLETTSNFFLRLAVMTHYFPNSGVLMPGLGVSLGGCF